MTSNMVIRRYRCCTTCGRTKRTTTKREHFICRSCRGFTRFIADKISGVEKFPFTLGEKHLAIIICLKEEALSAKKISERTIIPLATVYRLISQLLYGGFIGQAGLIYELKEKTRIIFIKLEEWDLEWLFLRKKEGDPRKMRFHAIQGEFVVSNPPNDFEKYLLRVFRLPFSAEIFCVGRNKNPTGLKFRVLDCSVVMSSPTSISVTFPYIWVNEVGESMVAQGYCKLSLLIDALGTKLEEIFPGLKIDCFNPFNLTYQEIAITDSKYAKRYYEEHGSHLKEEKLKTDKSESFETETTQYRTAAEDIVEGIRREKAEDEQ
ncbi:MAG: hypothetical protein Q7S55_04410 [Nanoarchaeota archaeon]|nr:hypothetical protein [Nanoarchaeota archaeon]